MRRTTWFTLSRHDGDPADPPPADPPADPATGDGDKDWKAEADKWKRLSRDNETRAKANADKAKRLDELEESQKTEAEKLAAARDAAEQRAQAATARAVRAEVRAAAGDFADPSDAVALLGDLGKYATGDDIDSDAIAKDLGELLERKPHLRKAAPGRPGPRPDPSQGGGREGDPVDYRNAPAADVDKALAELGIRRFR